MSQWGSTRTFRAGWTEIRVLAHCEGPPFVPLMPYHRIDQVVLMNSQGPLSDALFELVREIWVGKTHSEWEAKAGVKP